jgi:hypothetical protein
MTAAVCPKVEAGDERAVRALVAIMERVARFFGLDAKAQTSVTGEDGGPVIRLRPEDAIRRVKPEPVGAIYRTITEDPLAVQNRVRPRELDRRHTRPVAKSSRGVPPVRMSRLYVPSSGDSLPPPTADSGHAAQMHRGVRCHFRYQKPHIFVRC